MNYPKYENKLPYPSLGDVSERVRKKQEQIDNAPMTKAERTSALDAERTAALADHRRALRSYEEEAERLVSLFWADAAEEIGYGSLPNEMRSLIEGKAWEDGHSYGLQEVFLHLRPISEIVISAYKSGQASAKALLSA